MTPKSSRLSLTETMNLLKAQRDENILDNEREPTTESQAVRNRFRKKDPN